MVEKTITLFAAIAARVDSRAVVAHQRGRDDIGSARAVRRGKWMSWAKASDILMR